MTVCCCNHGWHIRPDDLYCGACGARVTSFEPVADTNLISVESTHDEIETEIWFRNTGVSCIDLYVPAQPDSLSVSFSGLPWSDRLVPSGDVSRLRLKARFDVLPEGGLVRTIPVHTKTDGVYAEIRFYRPGTPEVTAHFGEGKELLLQSDDPFPTAIQLYNRAGAYARVTWGEQPQWLEIQEQSVLLSPFTTRNVRCTIHPERAEEFPLAPVPLVAHIGRLSDTMSCGEAAQILRQGQNDDWQHQLSFEHYGEVTFESPRIERVVAGRAEVFRRTPVGDELQRIPIELGELVPGERHRCRFLLQNTGGMDLPVEGLYTSGGSEDGSFTASFLESVKVLRKTGNPVPFQFTVDAQYFAARSVPYRKQLIFDFGRHGELEVVVHFIVKPLDACTEPIAIDFGTSNSCAAISEDRWTARVIRPEDGENEYLPSVIYFFSKDDYIVGAEARREYNADPARGVSCIKRALLGDGISIHGKVLAPKELVKMIMRELICSASKDLWRVPAYLVVTVPVEFSLDHRRIIQEAAMEASGLRNVLVFDEPTAAAMHFVYNHRELFSGGQKKHVLVFDFGGGTLDTSVLEVSGRTPDILARRGDARLGGMDLDHLVASHLAERVRTIPGMDQFARSAITLKRRAFLNQYTLVSFGEMRREFYEEAEYLKIALSSNPQHEFSLSQLALRSKTGEQIELSTIFSASQTLDGFRVAKDEQDRPKALVGAMDRTRFNEIIRDKLDRAVQVAQNGLEVAQVPIDEIDFVLLTGQICHIPAVRERIKELFDGKQAEIADPEKHGFDLKTCVALGAAQMAHYYDKLQHSHLEVSSGRIGYLDTDSDANDVFVTVLPEKHPYGALSKVPVPLKFSETGAARLDIYRNNIKEDIIDAHTAKDCIRVGTITHSARAHLGQAVPIQLGLDKNGFLIALLNNVELTIEAREEENDDVL